MAQQKEYQARRAERRKKIRRRRIRIVLAVLFLLAVAVFVLLSLTVLFPVKEVKVSGSKRYTSQEIIASCDLGEEDNLFTFSADRLRTELRKKLPYIETVTVERKLPGTVVLKVTDATEYACYPVGGKYYAVSKAGFVLNEYDHCPDGIFTVLCGNAVTCKPGNEISYADDRTRRLAERLIELLEKEKIAIGEVDVSDPVSLKATVDGRFHVLFGSESNLEEKIAHLNGMIRNIDPARRGKINLSMWTPEKNEGTFIETAQNP